MSSKRIVLTPITEHCECVSVSIQRFSSGVYERLKVVSKSQWDNGTDELNVTDGNLPRRWTKDQAMVTSCPCWTAKTFRM